MPASGAVPLTLAQAMCRLRELAPEAFAKSPSGCRTVVENRFPLGVIPESALDDLAETLRSTYAPRPQVHDFAAYLKSAAGGNR